MLAVKYVTQAIGSERNANSGVGSRYRFLQRARRLALDSLWAPRVGEVMDHVMCWIAVLFRVRDDFPVIVAANRDEARDRPTRDPLRWPGCPAIWAGRDERGGGTWLGVNAAGLLAAVTNRPETCFDPARRSRGLLCRDVLRSESPPDARARFVADLATRSYNPFNLLCVNHRQGWAGTRRGDIVDLTPGLHVLSNHGDVDDDRLPVVQAVRASIATIDLTAARIEDLFAELGAICANSDGVFPLCRADGDRGTVSASLVAIDAKGAIAAYWYAPGPPNQVPFSPVTLSREE
jgi:hypothetical protein